MQLLITSHSNDNSLRVWDPTTGRQVQSFFEVSSCKHVPGTNTIIGAGRNDFSMFDINTGKRRSIAKNVDKENVIRRWWPEVSPDGKRLVTVTRLSYPKRIGEVALETWSLPVVTRKASVIVEGLRHDLIRFLPDGRHFLGYVIRKRDSTFFDEELLVWNYDDLNNPRSIFKHGGDYLTTPKIQAFAVSRDGKSVAIARMQSGAQLIDAATGKVIHNWPVPARQSVLHIQFSHDGKYVVGGRSVFRVWSVESGKVIQKIGDDEQRVQFATLSHESRLLAASGRDGRIYLWDFESHRLLTTLGNKGMKSGRCLFSPDDRLLVSNSNGASLLTWSLNPMAWPSNSHKRETWIKDPSASDPTGSQ